jgi:hypothetical protein
MKKIFFLHLSLLISAIGLGQSDLAVTGSYILSDEKTNFSENSIWYSDLISRRDSLGFSHCKSMQLEEHALQRALYFVGVIDNTTQNKKMSEAISHIPKTGKSHNRRFGDPAYFKESSYDYVPNYPAFKINGSWISVSGEIMQECCYFSKSEVKLSQEDLIGKMLDYHERKRGKSHVMSRYLGSEIHRRILESPNNTYYGSSVIYVIHTWYSKTENVWCNDVLMMNVTVFGELKPIE